MVMELKIESKSEEKEASTTVSDINQPLLIRGTNNNTETVNSTNIDLPSTSHGPVIQWAEGTVDNEFLGKKKSNCCCIYAKPRKWNESSSSSSSSDYSDSSSSPTDGHNHVNNDKSSPKQQNTHKHTRCTEHCRGHTKRCFRKKKTQDKDNDKDSMKNAKSENFEKPINQPSLPSTDDCNPNGS